MARDRKDRKERAKADPKKREAYKERRRKKDKGRRSWGRANREDD